MGRYLGNAIVTKMKIFTKGNNVLPDNEDELNKIIEEVEHEIRKLINISHYEKTIYEDGLLYEFKNIDFVNNNISDLVKEISNLTPFEDSFFEDIYNNLNDNDRLSFGKYDEKYDYKNDYDKEILFGKFYIRRGENATKEEFTFPTVESWFFYKNYELIRKFKVRLYIIPIWLEINKYGGEDETNLIFLMNRFSKNYFKNPLAECLIYHIIG